MKMYLTIRLMFMCFLKGSEFSSFGGSEFSKCSEKRFVPQDDSGWCVIISQS